MDWKEVQSICDTYGADALIVLSTFDSDSRTFEGKKVVRTKYRLIAQDKLTKVQIITYIIINSLVGICPLFFIPFKAVVVALCVIPLIIIYPFMKRITWWPQLWLGITFNWGVFVGYNSINNNFISLEMLAMYLACVFWTLAYDTVYGLSLIHI